MEGLSKAEAWDKQKYFPPQYFLKAYCKLFPLQSIKPESKVCLTELTRESISLCLFQTLDTAKTGRMYLPEANCLQHSAIKTSASVASTSFSETYLPISPKCFYLFWQKQSCNEKQELHNFFLLCLKFTVWKFLCSLLLIYPHSRQILLSC